MAGVRSIALALVLVACSSSSAGDPPAPLVVTTDLGPVRGEIE